jgi:hypothetical protein
MAQLVIAAAGAWTGGALFGAGELFLGVTGKGLGWIAGAMLGSAVAGKQRLSGPSLDDLRISADEYPQPEPAEPTT